MWWPHTRALVRKHISHQHMREMRETRGKGSGQRRDCVTVMGIRESLAEGLWGKRDAVRGTVCGMVQYREDGNITRTREAGSGGWSCAAWPLVQPSSPMFGWGPLFVGMWCLDTRRRTPPIEMEMSGPKWWEQCGCTAYWRRETEGAAVSY